MNVTGYSTQDGSNSFAAMQVIGSPNVYPVYTDDVLTWCPRLSDIYPFIQVQFAVAVNITSVQIYETYHAGAVKVIKALDGLGNWITLWSTASVQDIHTARIFAPVLSVMGNPSRDIRLELDCTAAGGDYVEIDAVKLVGTKI